MPADATPSEIPSGLEKRLANLAPPFKPGECGARRQSKRFLEMFSKLEAELGGNLSAVESALLTQACNLMVRAERTKNPNDVVRLSNSGARLLLGLQRIHKRKPATLPTLQEVLHRD